MYFHDTAHASMIEALLIVLARYFDVLLIQEFVPLFETFRIVMYTGLLGQALSFYAFMIVLSLSPQLVG
jgi:hypothetical protein